MARRARTLRALLLSVIVGAALGVASAALTAAPAERFNADSIDAFIDLQQSQSSTWSRLSDEEKLQITRLAQSGEALRRLIVIDVPALRALLEPAHAPRVAELLGRPDDAETVRLWQRFYEGSVLHIGNGLSDTPRIGYYNPIVDAWMMTDWRREAGSFALVKTWITTGERVRAQPQPAGSVPGWTAKGGSLATALAENYRASVGAFERSYPAFSWLAPADGSNQRDAAIAGDRLGLVNWTVASLSSDKSYEPALERLRQTIASGDAVALKSLVHSDASMPVEWIAGLSSAMRSNFRPTAVFERADGLTVTFGVPFSGRWVLVADYVGRGVSPELESLIFFDLSSVERGSP
jgi:hypothetical protein